MGSVVVMHGLGRSVAGGILLDLELNMSPALTGGFLTIGPSDHIILLGNALLHSSG